MANEWVLVWKSSIDEAYKYIRSLLFLTIFLNYNIWCLHSTVLPQSHYNREKRYISNSNWRHILIATNISQEYISLEANVSIEEVCHKRIDGSLNLLRARENVLYWNSLPWSVKQTVRNTAHAIISLLMLFWLVLKSTLKCLTPAYP